MIDIEKEKIAARTTYMESCLVASDDEKSILLARIECVSNTAQDTNLWLRVLGSGHVAVHGDGPNFILHLPKAETAAEAATWVARSNEYEVASQIASGGDDHRFCPESAKDEMHEYQRFARLGSDVDFSAGHTIANWDGETEHSLGRVLIDHEEALDQWFGRKPRLDVIQAIEACKVIVYRRQP